MPKSATSSALSNIRRFGVVIDGQKRAHSSISRAAPARYIRLATSSSITSVAPPPIFCTRASRDMRSIVLSRMKPMPPWNCTQSYMTSLTSSPQYALTMDTSRVASAPWRVEPGGVIDELAAGLDFRRKPREPLADGFTRPQRRAEGLARAHIVEREIERRLRLAHRHRADGDALVLEVAHDRVEAAAFLAENVLCRNAAIVEMQFGGVGRAPAMLVERAAHGEIRACPSRQETW